ncbi:MAG: DUF4349 domain-containing protein [Bacteroidota bacterium]
MKLLSFFSLLCIFSALLTFTSCGAYPNAPAAAVADSSLDASAEPQDRKLIYAAFLTLRAPQPDSTVNQIVQLATDLGGNIISTNSRFASVRVPAERFEAALEEIATYGKLKDKRLEGEDVTDAYRDYAIRLDNAEKSRQRYLELLALAQNVDEAITVERELERLNETIDLLKGRINQLDQLEAFSTINVTVEKKAKLGPLGVVFKGVYDGVKWLFVWE